MIKETQAGKTNSREVRIAFYGWSLEREARSMQRHTEEASRGVGFYQERTEEAWGPSRSRSFANLLLDWRFRKISFNPLNNLMR